MYKGDKRSESDNYKPMSVLSCISKIQELQAYHSKEADLIQQHQFAFVKESSSSYNCIDQNSRFMEIGYGQTGKGYMCFLFLAFDVIAHATLLFWVSTLIDPF